MQLALRNSPAHTQLFFYAQCLPLYMQIGPIQGQLNKTVKWLQISEQALYTPRPAQHQIP